MEPLIKVEIKDGIQVVDSRIIAKGLNIKHKSFMDTIRNYHKDLEDLGSLPFQTQ
ncbi:MAG: hypothetical protein OHK0053_25230 [Microscillaceae bacterium]